MWNIVALIGIVVIFYYFLVVARLLMDRYEYETKEELRKDLIPFRLILRKIKHAYKILEDF